MWSDPQKRTHFTVVNRTTVPLSIYYFLGDSLNAATNLTSMGRTPNFSPPSHSCIFYNKCLFCSVPQSRRVGMIKSRLCNRHQPVSCGWIHLHGAVGSRHRRTWLSVLPSEWREEAFHVGITACSNIETSLKKRTQDRKRKKTSARLCGKTQLWVSWSLNVSLKVNCRPKFISSDNIFCPKNQAAVFSVLPTRSLNRHLLKIAACITSSFANNRNSQT